MSSFTATLSQTWFNIQYRLFPFLEEQVDKLSDQHKHLISVLEVIKLESFLPCYRWGLGRPCQDRNGIARAFVAKTIFKLPYTTQIIQLLKDDKQLRVICGWEPNSKIPSESKFSRAFKEF